MMELLKLAMCLAMVLQREIGFSPARCDGVSESATKEHTHHTAFVVGCKRPLCSLYPTLVNLPMFLVIYICRINIILLLYLISDCPPPLHTWGPGVGQSSMWYFLFYFGGTQLIYILFIRLQCVPQALRPLAPGPAGHTEDVYPRDSVYRADECVPIRGRPSECDRLHGTYLSTA